MKETNLSVDIFFKKIIEDVNTEIENRINDPSRHSFVNRS